MDPIRPQSAAEAASVEQLGALLEVTINQRKPAEDLHGSDDISLQPKPGEALDIIPRVSRLDGETSDRVRAMESRTKRRFSRGFARFLVAICIGVAGTLAWQSYGEATKQIIAASAPELGWSPEAKQMIASWVQQLGWAKLATGPENTAAQRPVPKMTQAAPVAQTAPENVTPKAPAAPSIDPEQVHRMAMDLTALRQTVEQLAASQDQMVREIARLKAADGVLAKVTPAPAPPPPIAAAPAVAGRPAPGGAPYSANTQTEVALRANCGPDVQRLCRGISWENGGVIKCLNSHRMELSPICVAYFNGQKGTPKTTSPNR
jgi:hypothetical protein